ncbi:hypothetical protein Afil01_39460 [Actinorhabdospora filicis]|uniref:Uncharacterized protein n=1 Tax=Actinorhabdospora filicis TaxID=1785913 RepID=A0A9W6SLH2_9ACTN|nr:hypothetical protein [Actinorhabdospora filicis]GLZ79139.1 hypothetical protein Afil01_39460 [Actinorhabdospora filicis]
MTALRAISDRLLDSLVPRTGARAYRCIPLDQGTCGACAYGHEKYCCIHYDNCPNYCWWKQYPNGC